MDETSAFLGGGGGIANRESVLKKPASSNSLLYPCKCQQMSGDEIGVCQFDVW